MTVAEKAKQLYVNCENTNPNENTLLAYGLKEKGFDFYGHLVMGLLVNRYATGKVTDWAPLNKETFTVFNNEDWTNTKRTLYKLEKKGYVETKFENNQNFVRLLDNDFIFDEKTYRR